MVKLCKNIRNYFSEKQRVVLMKQGVLKAVHDEDLERFLDSIGYLRKIKAGRMSCATCGNIVTLDNFQCIYPENGGVKVCCSASRCYEKLVARGVITDD